MQASHTSCFSSFNKHFWCTCTGQALQAMKMLTRSISVPAFLVTKKTGHMYLNSYDPSQGCWLPGGTECSPQYQQEGKPRGTQGMQGRRTLWRDWHSELWETLRSLRVIDISKLGSLILESRLELLFLGVGSNWKVKIKGSANQCGAFLRSVWTVSWPWVLVVLLLLLPGSAPWNQRSLWGSRLGSGDTW